MLKRFSVSLEQKLLDRFDQFIGEQRYPNRSEAVRDLIRKALVRQEWQADKEVMGVISLVYDHHHHQLQETITELQHGFHRQIVSATHIHIDEINCLEVIIVRGKARQVQELAERLTVLRGVKDGNLAMSSTGGELH
ncbi:MAG: nickel-responsive transcriptional regulator NikR [Desulfobacteraceae bacterium]|nr:nickel-responsive transcriptional regulator NikR [Desulfobacteraceae bacterium]